MANQEQNNCILDIYWDRMFLNIIFHLEEKYVNKVFLYSKKEEYNLNLEKTNNENEYRTKLNITNINGKMLENANYEFKIKIDDNEEIPYITLPITNTLGYKLDTLDKVFRYYRYIYAYTINFDVKAINETDLTCIVRSEYMKQIKNPRKRCISNKNVIKRINGIVLEAGERFLSALYHIFSFIHPIKKNRILLMSETRAPISGNLKALDQRLKERNIDKKYKISYSFSTTLQENVVYTFFKWIGLLWKISKQEFIFVDDYSPIYKFINLSKKTKLIQVWHAGVGFKSVGYSRFGFGGPEPYNSCHRKYNYAIVGEESLIPVYEEVFGINKNKILPYGLPRMDYFLDKNKIEETTNKLYNEHPELKDRKVILFAPTFRGRRQSKAYYPYEMLDLSKIYELCKEQNYIFIVKMHPFVKQNIEIPEEYSTLIKDFSSYTDINDLFYVTDILITDYSSNVYEFSKLNRPILLYAFDLDNYQLVNKVHRSVNEYEFARVCKTFDELINNIENLKLEGKREIEYKEHQKASDLIIDNIILRGNKC